MSHTRRRSATRATLASIAAAGLLAAPGAALNTFAQADDNADDANGGDTMTILFLGGTGMLGPHVVERLVERGHDVTLFNRGNRDELFPDLEFIRGNRIIDVEPGLEPLREQVEAGRTWDVVIDTSNVHTWTEHSAELLKDAADYYLFTSTMSVYASNAEANTDESAPLAQMPDEVADGITQLPYDMNYFGAVKARCEAAAQKHFPGRTIIVRPGLIVGPRDFSHRFTYWPHRIAQGGEVLAPGSPETPIQVIDVRDLADFMVKLIEDKQPGVYNVNGPVDRTLTMGELLSDIKDATDSDATFTWVDGQWLAERGVHAWQHMPVWIPQAPGMMGFHTRSIAKATKAGLRTRSIEETAADTLTWFEEEYLPGFADAMAERGIPDQEFVFGEGRPGITLEREAELLAAWHARDDAGDHELGDAGDADNAEGETGDSE